jgi:hypothetical protein
MADFGRNLVDGSHGLLEQKYVKIKLKCVNRQINKLKEIETKYS